MRWVCAWPETEVSTPLVGSARSTQRARGGLKSRRGIVRRMIGTRALALAAAWATAMAQAGSRDAGEDSEDAFPTAATHYQSRLLPPGTTDARLGALADILLSRASGVLVVDRGLVPV